MSNVELFSVFILRLLYMKQSFPSPFSLSSLFIKNHISMLIVMELLNLAAQRHRIIPRRMFAGVLVSDIGDSGRMCCLTRLPRAWICEDPRPSVSSGVIRIKLWQPQLGQDGFPLSWVSHRRPSRCQPRPPPASLTAPSAPAPPSTHPASSKQVKMAAPGGRV